MSLESLTEQLRERVAFAQPLGYKVKIDLGDDGIIFWDGTGASPEIGNEEGEADTTLTMSMENCLKLVAGDLDPNLAYMTGRLKVSGSMGVALKMGTILSD